MPPRKRRVANTQPAQNLRRSTRRDGSNNDNAIPKIYREMLAEVAADSPDLLEASPRPVKRRKVSEEPDVTVDALFESPPRPATPISEPPEEKEDVKEDVKPQQVCFDDFQESDESDVEFEDVELDNVPEEASEEDEPQQELLKLDLRKTTESTPKKTVQRRKPLTKAERELRLDVHKWHLMSLMLHQLSRNVWCEDDQVHRILKPLVSRKIISLLHVDESQPSFQRNHSFMKGVEEVCAIWRREWLVTARGLRRPYWSESIDAQEAFDEAEDPIDLDDFRTAAQTRHGSRDLGAQLFCALLRSVAVDTRLVFSLQVLPYSGELKPPTFSTPKKSSYIKAPPQAFNSSVKAGPKKKKIVDSPHPCFWVEVLNPATATWIPLDPIVRNSINKPKTQFEPPASDHLNSMSYVIAFEEDNTARDVTRRYVQWFNAKTRKTRVENTKDGGAWFAGVMRAFARRVQLPRDEVEDDQLLQRAAAEGMPKNVQDFRQHPVYVLERHIRRNEVIHPRREVGKVSAGVSKNGKLESVFRRQDVHLCRTADAWYRRGKDVKIGEQPLKRVMPTNKRGARGVSLLDNDGEDEEDREGVALYAEYQTQIYEPPPVVDGKIPKNVYGNLDVYVPSMVPAGAVHIMHPLASRAAKVLDIDYTDAVTGFDFKGRQGTAVINGAVVAVQYTAAMVATIEGLEYQGTQESQAERSRVILTLFKRMLTALRIRERIEQDYGQNGDEEDETDDNDEDGDEGEDDDSTYSDPKVEDDGGGFMLEADETREKTEEQMASLQSLKNKMPVVLPAEVIQHPIKIVRSPHKNPESESKPELVDHIDLPVRESSYGGGGFMPEDNGSDIEGGFLIDDTVDESGGDGGGGGGGFLPNNDAMSETEGGGGFMVDNQEYADMSDTATTKHRTSIDKGQLIHTIRLSGDAKNPRSPIKAVPENEINGDEVISSTTKDREDSLVVNDGRELIVDEEEEAVAVAAGNASDVSLMSHDPDEDDDDPEWLAEAMDE